MVSEVMLTADPRAALMTLVERDGVSLAALSGLLGRNPAYLQQFVRRGSPRALEREDRQRLAGYFGVDEETFAAEPGRRAFTLPRLDVAASAGPGAHVDGEIVVGAEAIDPALAERLGLAAGQAGIIRVRGSSMEPGLVDGDLIVVDRARTTPGRRGGVFVVRIDGSLMVKRVTATIGDLSVTSDNPDAPPLPDGPVEVIGKVVWLMREPQ